MNTEPQHPAILDLETGLDFGNKDHLPVLERHLLGACLADSYAFDQAAEIVDAADFAIGEHAELFKACQKLRTAGREISVADLYEHLVSIGQVDFPIFKGNAAWWLNETAELEPIGLRARYYAIHIREAATFRRLRGAAHEILGYSYKPFGPAADVLGQAESMIFELSNSVGPRKETLATASGMMTDALNRIDIRRESGGRLLGIPSGYPDLDHYLAGFRPGQMIVVGARPSVGKTALAVNIAKKVAESGAGVLFFSLEMPQQEIADRLLAIGSGVSMHKINSTRFDDGDVAKLAVEASTNGFGGCDLFLDDNCDMSGERMLQVSRRAVRKFRIQLIVVDYLQLMRPENPRENRNAQVGGLARKVKHIARELKVPVICLAQLNREVENRNGAKPRLSDLRDSGEIEQHADAVILLHRDVQPDNRDPVWPITLVIAKNRNGPTGEATLGYVRTVMKFDNYSPSHGEVRN